MLHLKANGRAASTRNHYLHLCTKMFRWATRGGLIETNPVVDLDRDDDTAFKRAELASRHRRLQGDEDERLLNAANSRLQRLVVAALETGCRQGELLKLQVCDVHQNSGTLRIWAENSKSKRTRDIPISVRLRAVLAMALLDPIGEPLPPKAYVFGNAVGERIASPKTAFQNACRRAGIVDLCFHDLRHEAGSRRLDEGWTLAQVRDLLGHKDISTTNRYLNVTARGLQEAMRKSDEQRAICKELASEEEEDLRLRRKQLPNDPAKRLIH